eukprot:gnl/TRDRNA2_/TRDRNA2_125280_c0_seq2.p1 gnl/TRDRNA2_/TRDRNA2_125280_c0~~gnl/TRDRNA2_/TRDRNA2_125280_c0_seq2.p1  ORF type:complete len:314 (+),score=47.13 gnl/TRDRNA2_/TRDRNA2_125280_c0_seq2:86-1027(+)
MGAKCPKCCGETTLSETPVVWVQSEQWFADHPAGSASSQKNSMLTMDMDANDGSGDGVRYQVWHQIPVDTALSWRDEWVAMRTEELELSGQKVPRSHFEYGAPGSIDQMAQALREYIAWQVDAGWPPEHAVPYTLLAVCGRAAMARALRDKSNDYRASTELVRNVLQDRARQLQKPAPLAYGNLAGQFGLATEDPAWEMLLGSASVVGMSFSTSALAAGYVGPVYFPDEEGFYVGVVRRDKVHYELQDSDIVCFRSEQADERGFHSLIPAAEGTYDLPPLSVVRLEKSEGPGEWTVLGKAVKRRLFTVTVTYS